MLASKNDLPKLNIGVLGYGFMGRMRSHALSVIAYTYPKLGVLPVHYAVAGLGEEQLSQFASRFGYLYYTTEWRQVIADPQVDAILVCLPEHLHEEASIAALKAGKHVFTEKALALDSLSGHRMLDAAMQSTRIHMVGFNYRFLPAVQFAHHLIEQGVIGKIYTITGRYFQESGHDPQRPAEQVGHAFGPYQLGSARGLGSHLVDIARFLVGEIVAVSASFHTFIPTRQMLDGRAHTVKADDYAAMTVEFNSGAIGQLATSKIATGRKNHFGFEINASKGSLIFDLEQLNCLQVYLSDTDTPELRGFHNINVTEKQHPLTSAWWPPAHNLGWEHSHIAELKHFIECVDAEEEVSPLGATFEDGCRAVDIIEAAFQSSQENTKMAC
jgi:predicted dehydrogenase